ncbi:hypothetical protein phytr_5260 [Candidatus Phycorickettsia trachydisci]|uniref:Uncharacterized protein n=1 Tax=Candidatus Phycorickettsia trachydisci TaxID=2115978 RepID=A0A2P1P878_9RICK|nr:hypothetical protein [Candidatus Phycorickettsia trachydisci]AVP87472.1 hypothetical protein phytr_5260 [Candidatus Phycorickettsia trachydisci]
MTYDQILARMILALEENDIDRFIELSYQIEIPAIDSSTPVTQVISTSTPVTIATGPTPSTQTKSNIISNSTPPFASSPPFGDTKILHEEVKTDTTGADCKFIPQ